MQAQQHLARRTLVFLSLGVLVGLSACREGSEAVSFLPIGLPLFGADGCNAPNNTFVGPTLAYQNLAAIGSLSQIAASLDEEVLFVTGADGSILELDFTADPLVPVVTTLVAPGVIDALLATVLVPAPAAVLSGIAVLDQDNLVVIEHASNTVLIVDRVGPDAVGFYLGFPSAAPSLIDGPGDASRFGFGASPVQIISTGDGRLFIADGGNEVIREVQLGAPSFVRRIAGLGVPFSADGSLAAAGFDGPNGLTINCAGELLVTEGGAAGNRLRVLRLGPDSFFGGASGTAATLAGEGTPLTVEGNGVAASLAGPVSPVSTAAGEVYWVDSATGILRRLVVATGDVDCPMFGSCAAAGGGSFSGAGNYSAAITMSGRLYVLDGVAGEIQLVSP